MRLSISFKAVLVNFQHRQRLVRDVGGDAAVVPDLRVVAHAAEQVVRDARRAAAAPGDFVRASGFDLNVQQCAERTMIFSKSAAT